MYPYREGRMEEGMSTLKLRTDDLEWLKIFLTDCINEDRFPGCETKKLSSPYDSMFHFWNGKDRFGTIKRIVGVVNQLGEAAKSATTKVSSKTFRSPMKP